LLIDELRYLTLKPEQANAFCRLMDQRCNRVLIIITTILDLPDWYELFQKKLLVDALLDRRSITASPFASTARRCEAQAPAARRSAANPGTSPSRRRQAAHGRLSRVCATAEPNHATTRDPLASDDSLRRPRLLDPEQALAVVELVDDLRELIWAHYHLQLVDELRRPGGQQFRSI
jgi:IstB-like ATP binding protein